MSTPPGSCFPCFLCGDGVEWKPCPAQERVQLGQQSEVAYDDTLPVVLFMSATSPRAAPRPRFTTTHATYDRARGLLKTKADGADIALPPNCDGCWKAPELNRWVLQLCRACAMIALPNASSAPSSTNTPTSTSPSTSLAASPSPSPSTSGALSPVISNSGNESPAEDAPTFAQSTGTLPGGLFYNVLRHQRLVPYQNRVGRTISVTDPALAHLPPLHRSSLLAFIRQHLHRTLGLEYVNLRIEDSVVLSDLPARLLMQPHKDDPALCPDSPGLVETPTQDGQPAGERLVLPLDVAIEHQLAHVVVALLRRGARRHESHTRAIMQNPILRKQVWANLGLFDSASLLGFLYYAHTLPEGVALMRACQAEVPTWFLQTQPLDDLVKLARYCDSHAGGTFATERLREAFGPLLVV